MTKTEPRASRAPYAPRSLRRLAHEADTQRPYLQQFLGFIGIDDVEFVLAEGLAMGDEVRTRSLSEAQRTIDTLTRIAA